MSAVTDEDLLARQAALQDRAREVLAGLDLGALTADEELRGRITAEQRITVLRIKDYWHRQPAYPHHVGGLDIYTAVIDDGVRTLDGFSAWLAARDPGGAG